MEMAKGNVQSVLLESVISFPPKRNVFLFISL
jgi:hypothetical protein